MTDSSTQDTPHFNEDFRDPPYHKQKTFNWEDLLDRKQIVLDTKEVGIFIHNKRIMVTGAAGSIGRNLVKQILLFKPKTLFLIDRWETGIHELQQELSTIPGSETDIRAVIGDITNDVRMKMFFQQSQPQVIFHAAAYKHVHLMEGNAYEAIKTNILGTKILANLAVEYWVEKFIFISTDKAVNPTGVMGATKRYGEIYVQSFDNRKQLTTQFIITRFGNVLGTAGSAVPHFLEQIKAGGPVTITHPGIKRYFITMNEACQLVLHAGALGKPGEVFVLDMGESILIEEMVRKMILLSGLKTENEIKVNYVGLRPGEKLLEEKLREKENQLARREDKMTIAQPDVIEKKFIDHSIKRLEKTMDSGDENELVLILKEAIPEYISHNSAFEKLDISRSAKAK